MQTLTGINLKEALREAIQLGCRAWIARRTGEYVVQAPDGRRVRLNSRRKDAPRVLTCLLGQLHRGSDPICDSVDDTEDVDVTTDTATIDDAEELTDETIDAVEESLDAATTTTVNEPPAPVEQPKPTSMTDQLRAFREMRKELVENANGRMAALKSEGEELTEMLVAVETELKGIEAELAELGVTSPMHAWFQRHPQTIDDKSTGIFAKWCAYIRVRYAIEALSQT